MSDQYKITENNQDIIVFLDKFLIDMGTMKQIKSMGEHRSLEGTKIRIMPDCHRGSGCCIGFTYTLKEKIVPQFVGGDIGCGILTYKLNKKLDDIKIPDFEKVIRDTVVMGSGFENVHQKPIVTDKDLELLYDKSSVQSKKFAEEYFNKFGKDITQYIPKYDFTWFKKKCETIEAKFDYAMKSLGTLGGGNHYIEVNKDKDNNLYLTIHCGSRNFGSKICYYHQHKITDNRKFDYAAYSDFEKQINRKYKDSKVVKQYLDEYSQKWRDAKHPEYLEDEEAHLYYMDMIFCQNYALLNRRLILRSILEQIKEEYHEEVIIESIHNYIDFQDFIVRKGAISAYKDELCIISLNMRDGILLCKGKGNPEWNYSSAHGSGRILQRHQAHANLNMKYFKESMEGIYSTSVVKETLDESPLVYKDSELIKKAIGDTVDIIEQLKPVINLKALT
jgi:tRNA-splicing ligase RtcB